MSRVEQKLLKAFLDSKNERELQPFFKRNKLLVRNALNAWAWNHAEAIPEFQLGADFRADWLILSADSGSWNAVLVEMKSHRTRPYTADGLPSRSLNTALRQLDDWERWISRNEALLRSSLSKRLHAGRVPAMCSNADCHVMAASEILDFNVYLQMHYKVVLGRRAELSSNDRERRASLLPKDRELVTYDRFVDVARKFDAAAE